MNNGACPDKRGLYTGEGRAQLWAAYGEPPVFGVYGEPDDGKTLMLLRMFGHRGLFIGPPGAFKGARNEAGVLLDHKRQVRHVRNLYEAVKVLNALRRAPPEIRDWFLWVVLDDVSVLADNTMPRIDKTIRKAIEDKEMKPNEYERWTRIKAILDVAREMIRYDLNMGAGVSAYPREPESKSGKFYKGGPKFPSRARTSYSTSLAMVTEP